MRICLIEDDPLVLEALVVTMTGLGHESLPAPTVDQALDVIGRGVDVAVVDMLMPDRDGLDFIMAARESHPDLKIIAMSGGGRLDASRVLGMARSFGARSVLPKPFSASELQEAFQA